jgi:hypothetical protein
MLWKKNGHVEIDYSGRQVAASAGVVGVVGVVGHMIELQVDPEEGDQARLGFAYWEEHLEAEEQHYRSALDSGVVAVVGSAGQVDRMGSDPVERRSGEEKEL